MMKRIPVIMTIGAISVLSACSATQEQFDFSNKAPDEFAVVKRAPLELPPNYDLRPPRPGEARPQESTAKDEAKSAIFGTPTQAAPKQAPAPTVLSEGEAILLQKTGVDANAPDIRAVIDQETKVISEEKKPTINRILGGITGKKYDAPASVVDPTAEAARIKENMSNERVITTGETPTITE